MKTPSFIVPLILAISFIGCQESKLITQLSQGTYALDLYVPLELELTKDTCFFYSKDPIVSGGIACSYHTNIDESIELEYTCSPKNIPPINEHSTLSYKIHNGSYPPMENRHTIRKEINFNPNNEYVHDFLEYRKDDLDKEYVLVRASRSYQITDTSRINLEYYWSIEKSDLDLKKVLERLDLVDQIRVEN